MSPKSIPSEVDQERALREQARRDALPEATTRTGVDPVDCVLCLREQTTAEDKVCEFCRAAFSRNAQARADRAYNEEELRHWDRRAARDGYTNEDRY